MRKNYTDNLGRTWTWDALRSRYAYVPKTPKTRTQKDLATEILSVKTEIASLEDRLDKIPTRTKETDLIRATLRRRDAKLAKLKARLADLKASKKKSK